MKLRYLLLFAASALAVTPIPTISAPVQIAYESRAIAGSAETIYRRVNPAVVTVFAGREIGSGSVVSPNGLVITNNHVVNGAVGSRVSARTFDGQSYTGQVIAIDRRSDLALIQLQTGGQLPTVPLANSTPRSGEPVLAIGSPYGRPGVLTTGTFSSMRSNGDLQSRVVLQPGNSGGPLLNTSGEMVGVNKAILESAQGNNTGISIATSVQVARSFIAQNGGGFVDGGGSIASRAPVYQAPIYQAPVYQAPTDPAIAQFPGGMGLPKPQDPIWRSRQNSRIYGSQQPNNQFASRPNGQYSGGQYSGGAVVIPTPNDYRSNPAYESSQAPIPQYRNPGNSNSPVPSPSLGSNQAIAGAQLGVTVDTRTLVVQSVNSGSAAANGGLQVGDRLLGVNGNILRSFDDLKAFVSNAPTSAQFTISRNGQATTVGVQF